MISSTRKAAILLVCTLLLGILLGAAGMAVADRKPERPRRERSSDWFLDHLTRSLKLTPTQRDSVGAVLHRYGPVMESVMQEIRPRLDSVRGAMRDQISAQLTPTQRQAYEEMLREFERRHGEGSKRDGR